MLVKRVHILSIAVLIMAIILTSFPFSIQAAGGYWFNNAVDTSPSTLGNYWLDAPQTIPAPSLPDPMVDTIHIVAGATYNGDAIFNGVAHNAGIVTGNAIFNDNSLNVYSTGRVNGNAFFYNNSVDRGRIDGNAFFYEDSLHEEGTTYGDIFFFDNATCSISINYGYATFNDNSVNVGGLEANATFNDNAMAYVYINGNVIFNDNTYNYAGISGDATFNNNSINEGNIIPLTKITFNNSSINNNTINGNSIFADSSINNGDIIGNATFLNDLSENTHVATATTKTREYTIPTTTLRNFITDGPWTVIANGSAVNITGASYNSLTIFRTINGGSFIPSFDHPSAINMDVLIGAPPQGPFSLQINNGELSTQKRLIQLKFSAGSNITRMALSNRSSFEMANLIPFSSVITWDICGSEVTCLPGNHPVYAKFYTRSGQVSSVVSGSIIYQPGTTIKTEPATSPKPPVNNSSSQNSSTIQKIFKNTLRFGNISEDVKRLQQFLNTHTIFLRAGNRGVGSSGHETHYFGIYTRAAVRKYQQAHHLPITGVLDSATRESINKEYKK